MTGEDRTTPPATAPGKPITEYDLALARRTFRSDSWPVSNLIAEIDRLRAIEEAALEFVAASGWDTFTAESDIAALKLRAALEGAPHE